MTPTPKQVADWAREASATGDGQELSGDALLRFAALACAWQREKDARLRNVAGQVLRDMQAQDVLIEWQTLLAEAIRSDCAEPGKAG